VRITAGTIILALLCTGLFSHLTLAAEMERVQPRVTIQRVETPPGIQPYRFWRLQYRSRRNGPLDVATLQQQAKSGATVPFWTSSITSPLDNVTYTTSMVGKDIASHASVDIQYVPIMLRLHFAGGVVLDPTATACGDNVGVATRFFNSPIFKPSGVVSNGVNVAAGADPAGVQLVNGFQRANFWATVKSTAYGVNLVPASLPVVVDVTAPRDAAVSQVTIQCGGASKTVPLGQIDINEYDAIIAKIIEADATPSQLPIVLTYNVVQTENGGCCILGYHSAIAVPDGTQTYAVGSYIDSGIFAGVDDIVVWAHEIGEWMNDPFVQASVPGGGAADLTPSWGHVGQVAGCEGNLEVGDPLSGTEFAIPTVDGFQYHTQDLAFVDWFYRTPPRGTGGKYSFLGTFTSVQGACK
jgi:hypothetical protein